MPVDKAFNKKPNRYLGLSIKDPFLRATPLAVKVDDSLIIVATVKAKNIARCKASISYDPIYFLLKTPPTIWLPEGSYSRDIRWELRSLKISLDSLWVEITAKEEEGGLIQTVGIPITIS